MVAIEITQSGGPEVLVPVTRPIPMPASGEVLIKVSAAGVNRPDVMQRRGQYAPPPGASDIPGLEVAGEVVAIAADVSRFKIGDRVCGLIAGGGMLSTALYTKPMPCLSPIALLILRLRRYQKHFSLYGPIYSSVGILPQVKPC